MVARWNAEITEALAAGAMERARLAGAACERVTVAGSFELPAAVALLADTARYDAIVPLGCLVRGDTPHFDVLARAVADGLMELSLTYPVAIPFGVLTCDTIEQARDRAGGREGNKGADAMDAALELAALRQRTAASARSTPARSRTASSRDTS